jgi:hypothetical protein
VLAEKLDLDMRYRANVVCGDDSRRKQEVGNDKQPSALTSTAAAAIDQLAAIYVLLSFDSRRACNTVYELTHMFVEIRFELIIQLVRVNRAHSGPR